MAFFITAHYDNGEVRILTPVEIIKSDKFKRILFTVLEILVVAGLIFGILMFFQRKVTKEANKAGNLNGKGIETETNKVNNDSNNYEIVVNKKLNTLIIYKYFKDKKSKTAYKAFKCSIGKKIPTGNYKTHKSYTWVENKLGWHRYNTQLEKDIWVQSATYKDKYAYRLSKTSYKSIGKKQSADKSILLSAGDAAWIYNNCREKTKISVIKGNKKDKIPVEPSKVIKAYKYCGWDPTDPDSNNPYRKLKKGEITQGESTVYVEKGDAPDYLGNILVVTADGKNITGKLKYNKIDIKDTKTQNVTFKYKVSKGKTLKIKQKFKVIDTTPPKVSCSKSLFTLQVKSKDVKDVKNKDNVKKIQDMVKSSVSVNESTSKVDVYTVEPGVLEVGEKVPVVIKAKDKAGNIGSTQVMCEIKLQSSSLNKKYKPSKELENKRKAKKKKLKK